MSSSTALLPKKKDDHPIFLRVCHSPWSTIGQKALVSLRGLAAAYMCASFAMIIDYELRHSEHKWLAIFEFSNISYFMQTLYHVVAFTWTFMHLHYPHHGSSEQTWAKLLQRSLSPPRQNSTTKNRTWFSIFYSAANSFPFTSILIHWAVEIPTHKAGIPANQTFNGDWHTTFFVLNKYGVNGVMALIETLCFSSIRTPEALGPHVVGLTALSGMALGWQYIGYIATDKYGNFFLDHKQVGWEWVVSSWFLFPIANNFFFTFMNGMTSLRQQLTKKSESKKSGYQQLPQ